NPFELAADAEAACFDMDLWVACGPRVTEQERKWKVVAAEGGAAARSSVGDCASLEEPVQLHTRPASQLDVGYQPALLWDINRQDAHRHRRGDYFRSFRRRRPRGSDTRHIHIVDRHAIHGSDYGRTGRGRSGSVYHARRAHSLVVIGLGDYALHEEQLGKS